MKKKALLILCFVLTALLWLLFLYRETRPLSGTIRLCDYGVIADMPQKARQNTIIINRIIKRASENAVLNFPQGRIYMKSGFFGGIKLNGKKNLTLLGEETVLVNASYSPYGSKKKINYNFSNILKISDCENIKVKGLTLDFLNPVNASGKIVKCKDGYTYIKLFSQAESPNPLKNGASAVAVNVFDEKEKPLNEYYLKETNENKLEKVEEENNLFRLKGRYAEEDKLLCVRLAEGNFACPVLVVEGTSNLELTNITVHAAPSATFYAPAGNSNFSFNNFNICPEPNEKALFSSNEDGIHIKGLRGKLCLENCTFTGMGDDSLNVHSKAAVLHSLSGNEIVAMDAQTKKPIGNSWAEKQDEIEFFDADFNCLGKAEIAQFSDGKIKLDKLPSGVKEGIFMQNISYSPEVYIKNCSVTRGRARGFLLQAKKVRVENCSFTDLGLSGVRISPDLNYWYEMGPTKEAVLLNNTFVACCTNNESKSNEGAVQMCLIHDENNRYYPSKTVHGTLSAENNRFIACKEAAFCIRNTKRVFLFGNVYDGVTRENCIEQCESIEED